MHQSFFKQTRRNKYNNKKTLGYHSGGERNRAWELETLERAGQIRDLRKQVRYDFIHNNILLCSYYADFVYIENGVEVVEDYKGFLTDEYKLKRKMMLAFHGITIFESGPKQKPRKRRPKKIKSATKFYK